MELCNMPFSATSSAPREVPGLEGNEPRHPEVAGRFDWGLSLPSIDPQCLALIAYLNITGYEDYSIVECNDPALSPTGELPMLHDGKNWIGGANRILAYLSKTGHNADKRLSKEMVAKSVSYQALVDENLADTILFSWFADSENYISTIRKTYSDLLPFPSRYYVPTQMKKSAIQRVQKYGGRIESSGSSLVNTSQTQIYDIARDCYRVLNRRLGEQDFFFGDAPTTLDAKVFGYLALQMYPEIPNRRFGMILESQFPRLARYCDRCRERFLSGIPKPVSTAEAITAATAVQAEGGSASNPFMYAGEWLKNTFQFGTTPLGSTRTTKEKSAEERDFARKRVLAVGLGLVAMVAYVIGNGLIVIGTEDDEEDGYSGAGEGVFGLVEGGAPMFEEVHLPAEDFDGDDD
ncbi:metaxin 1 [Mortierella alpina]|nr:metaxin 1 [Mortierella alpina]